MAAAGDLCVLPLLRIEREEALTDVAAEPNPRRWLILAVVGTAFSDCVAEDVAARVPPPPLEQAASRHARAATARAGRVRRMGSRLR